MYRRSRYRRASDEQLVEYTRAGDDRAFAQLWSRHEPAVHAATRSFTGFDPDDIAQETGIRLLQQLRAGKGPQLAFRAYAIMTARRVAIDTSRRRSSGELTGSVDDLSDSLGSDGDSTAEPVLENRFILSVFASLPDRWREVLWHRDVEDRPVHEICATMGMTENATSALIRRAREGFKQEWIAAHLHVRRTTNRPECAETIEHLPKYARGKTPAAVTTLVQAHLLGCPECTALAAESEAIHRKLAAALLTPVVAGSSVTGGIAAWHAAQRTSDVGGSTASGSAGSSAGVLSAAPAVPTATASGAASLMTAPAIVIATLTTVLAIGGVSAALTLSGVFSPDAPAAPVSEPSSADEATLTSPPGNDAQHARKSGKQTRGTADTAAAARDSGSATHPSLAAEAAGLLPAEDTQAPPWSPVSTAPETIVSVLPAPVTPAQPGGEGPQPTPQPEPGPQPEPELEPQPGVLVSIPGTLTALPLDGVETGVYPRLVGERAVPGATIDLTVSNDRGEVRQAQVTVDKLGSWSFTPEDLLGTLRVEARQQYTVGSTTYREEPSLIGQFTVGDGLQLSVVPISTHECEVRVTGFGSASPNQVVSITSSRLGVLVAGQAMTAPGEATFRVPYNWFALGSLTYWQGTTSSGPHREWHGWFG